MVTAVREKVKQKAPGKPTFRDPATMTEEQLTDPDYRLKQIIKDSGGLNPTCSKCHHCR